MTWASWTESSDKAFISCLIWSGFRALGLPPTFLNLNRFRISAGLSGLMWLDFIHLKNELIPPLYRLIVVGLTCLALSVKYCVKSGSSAKCRGLPIIRAKPPQSEQ